MGCNVSRLDSRGPTFPARLRPLLLQRFDEIKVCRNSGRTLKDPTPSKKELLDKDSEEENNASQNLLPTDPRNVTDAYSADDLRDEALDNKVGTIAKTNDYDNKNDNEQGAKKNRVVKKDGRSIGMGKNERKGSKIIDDDFTDVDEDDDDDENGRMIGHEDDEAFPGSPSFRVYFKDDEVDRHIEIIGKKDGLIKTISSDNGMPSKESSLEKKKTKKGKKMSFRKVLPKNLLSVKSCYTRSHSSHDNSVLLTI